MVCKSVFIAAMVALMAIIADPAADHQTRRSQPQKYTADGVVHALVCGLETLIGEAESASTGIVTQFRLGMNPELRPWTPNS